MVKLSEVRSKEEILLMIKFTKEDYVNSIVNGNLYMNNIKYFVDLENRTGIKGQGDKYEASNVISDVEIKFYKAGTDQLIAEGHAEEIIDRSSFFDDLPIFCITAFSTNDFKIIRETRDYYEVAFDVEELERNRMLANFGEKAILINPKLFLDKIDGFFKNGKTEYVAGKVNYKNLKINDKERIMNYRNHVLLPMFTKDKYYEYQREFRIVALGKRTENNYIANIGSLEKIAFFITNTKEVFTEITLQIKK